MITVPFVVIYTLVTTGSLIILFHPFLDSRAEESFRFWIIFIAIVELVIGAIVNLFWLKQPFGPFLLWPIVLTALILILVVPFLIDKVSENDWGSLTVDYWPLWYKMLGLRYHKFYRRLFFIVVIALIGSINFAMLTSKLPSLLDFISENPDSLLFINNCIFRISAPIVAIVTLEVASLIILERAIRYRNKERPSAPNR